MRAAASRAASAISGGACSAASINAWRKGIVAGLRGPELPHPEGGSGPLDVHVETGDSFVVVRMEGVVSIDHLFGWVWLPRASQNQPPVDVQAAMLKNPSNVSGKGVGATSCGPNDVGSVRPGVVSLA